MPSLSKYLDYIKSLPSDWTMNQILDELADRGVITEPNALRLFLNRHGIPYKKAGKGRSKK